MLSLAEFFLGKMRERTKSGFTLVELLVVVTISMVIGAAAIMNFTGGERSNSVSRAAEMVLVKVRDVQNRATTVAEGNGEVPCGYGIHYEDETSIRIFKIEPGSSDCEDINSASSDPVNRKYEDSSPASDRSDLELLELKKPNIVKIEPFSDIYFVPPEGLVYIDGERTTGASSTIKVCERTRCSENNKKIKVSVGGKINLEE